MPSKLSFPSGGGMPCLTKSGTGSPSSSSSCAAGAGEVVVFEFDKVKGRNLNRILHSRRRDVESEADKATRLVEAAAETGLPTRVIVAPGGDIRDPETALELRACDIVFGYLKSL